MQYLSVVPGRFISRPNRFVAQVEVEGVTCRCHVKNTGRCGELLLPGARVYVQPNRGPGGKTTHTLVAVDKGGVLFNLDSQAPNRVFGEFVRSGGFVPGLTLLRPETVFGKSRFDFYLEYEGRRMYLEVKGVTLEQSGVALFPDAPTERGVKHMRELIACRRAGYEAAAVFVLQFSGAECFTPHAKNDPAFARAVRDAAQAGVELRAYACRVTPCSLELAEPVPVVIG